MGITVARWAGVLLVAGLFGCHGTPTQTAEPKGYPSPIHGQIHCEACRVHYFDGTKLHQAILSGSEYAIPAATNPMVLFASGPQQIPQIAMVRTASPPPMRLEKDADPRGGYLAGVVVKTQVGGKRSEMRTLEPVAEAEVVVTLGRARHVISTDKEGRFFLALPANTYRVSVDGQHWDVTVPRGDTALLPVVVARTVID